MTAIFAFCVRSWCEEMTKWHQKYKYYFSPGSLCRQAPSRLQRPGPVQETFLQHCEPSVLSGESSSSVNGEIFRHVSFTAIKINESWPVATPVLWSSHGKYLFHYITLQALCVRMSPHLPSPHLILIITDRPEKRCPPGLGPRGVQHRRAGRVHHGDVDQR